MRTRKALAGLATAMLLATGTAVVSPEPAQAATHCGLRYHYKRLEFGLNSNIGQSVTVQDRNCVSGRAHFKHITRLILEYHTNHCALILGYVSSLQFDITIAYGNPVTGRQYHRVVYSKCNSHTTLEVRKDIIPRRRIGRVYRSWDEWNVNFTVHKHFHRDPTYHRYGNLYPVF